MKKQDKHLLNNYFRDTFKLPIKGASRNDTESGLEKAEDQEEEDDDEDEEESDFEDDF